MSRKVLIAKGGASFPTSNIFQQHVISATEICFFDDAYSFDSSALFIGPYLSFLKFLLKY